MIKVISPVDDSPCRSCVHEREEGYDGCCGLKGFKCVLDYLGHKPKSFAMYGADSQEDGESKCSDYLHDEKAWW